MVASQNEARAAGNDVITVDHLVLGLLSEPESLAARDHDQGRRRPRRTVRAAGACSRGHADTDLPPTCPDLIPFDAGARKALELTFREALRLGHNYIGTEHLLLALLEVEGGTGVLADARSRQGPWSGRCSRCSRRSRRQSSDLNSGLPADGSSTDPNSRQTCHSPLPSST